LMKNHARSLRILGSGLGQVNGTLPATLACPYAVTLFGLGGGS
jgi:hypothetical protein